MLGLENPLHIAIVLVVVLLVFGAKRLPEIGRSLGSLGTAVSGLFLLMLGFLNLIALRGILAVARDGRP